MKVWLITSGDCRHGVSPDSIHETAKGAELEADKVLRFKIECYGDNGRPMTVDRKGTDLTISKGGSTVYVKEYELKP